uniref:Coiled-coil domain-containing protein 22 n=1 Tax=Melopsittacus undulatus TaxID=13146 RepID=A0A8V5GR30_MELUD
MEEVDRILIHSLRPAGTAVPPEVQSVRDLTPELVVEASVRCLRAVNPTLGAPLSPLLPPGISARFRLASDLAAACQELGFGGDVGYQTFLYSSEHDTRRLLLFLVEKLPRDESESGAEPPGKSGALLRAIGTRIREQLGVPWVPPLCRTPLLQRLQVSGAPPPEYVGRKRLRARLRALEPLRQACPPRPPGPPLDPAWLQEAFGAGGGRGALPKGSRFTHTQHLTHEQVRGWTWGAGGGGFGDTGARQASEEAALEQALAQLDAAIESCRGEMRDAQLSLTQVEAEVQQGRLALGGREDALRLKHQAIELLPDAQSNMAKLQLVVEASGRRIVSLAGQWERHRGPLLTQYRHLRALRDSAQLESSRRLSELRVLHERSRSAAAEAQRKEELYKTLVAELEALPRDVSRAIYTQRILEIVGNIRKQKEEISKILVDTRALQKEINSLVGKLERTFSVTDELLFKDAKRDEVVRKAYKYLAALHENCAQLIRTIEDTGTIQREIRDLEEQIEAETSSKPPASLERILSDCRALREENAALAARPRR